MSDITKLPKWAQREIETLTANVAYWKAAATESEGESNTFLDLGDIGSNGKGLGLNSRIAFQLRKDDHYWRNTLTVRVKDGELLVQGDRGITVRPSASNVVTIRFDAQ